MKPHKQRLSSMLKQQKTENPTGAGKKQALRVTFDSRLKLEFHGSKVTFETEVLMQRGNLMELTKLSEKWIDRLRKRQPMRELILDMDSSVSETYGKQEGTAYNGHFGCTCYHPLFCFNQFGDVEQSLLRDGNVHS